MLKFQNTTYVSGMNKTQMRLSEAIRREKITACIVTIKSRDPNTDGWLVYLKYKGKQYKSDFYLPKDDGIIPTGADAIKIILDLSTTIENYRSIHEWARDLGIEYKLDSREIFARQKERSKEIQDFFGELYFTLINCEHNIE